MVTGHHPLSWAAARAAAYAAGVADALPPVDLPLAGAADTTLADALRAGTDLPAFPTSSVDGWATRGPGPWTITGRVLAGARAAPLTESGHCVEIATGAQVPAGTEQIVRLEDASRTADGQVTGTARRVPEWRSPGDEARYGEELLPAGTPVTPGVLGLAASAGADTLRVRQQPRACVLVFGDELLTSGLPGHGRVRDALGPSVPGWLARLGACATPAVGPVGDTLDAHVEALHTALTCGQPGPPDLICTTGGTMRGPVDHLHQALGELGARLLVDTVEVRPGFPMLLAELPRPAGGTALLAGLPGNPQSAVVAVLSLVAPALAGLAGRREPALGRIELAGPVPGRGRFTHLALVDRAGTPVGHAGSAMLRGLAISAGFAVIEPGRSGSPGDEVPLLPLPLLPGEIR